MATIKFHGDPIQTSGNLPGVGQQAPDFQLTAPNLSDHGLSEYKGQRVVMNIFPSVDTGTCAASVRAFNKEAAGLDNTVVLCISRDLPFAQSRFCAAEGIDQVMVLSEFRDRNFSDAYGLRIAEGPLAGLLSRAVVVLDENGVVRYTEQVDELTQEPNYARCIEALNSL